MEFLHSIVSFFLHPEDDTPNWTRIAAAVIFGFGFLLISVAVVNAVVPGPPSEPESAQAVVQVSPTATRFLMPTLDATATHDIAEREAATPIPDVGTAGVATAAAATEIAAATAMASDIDPAVALPTIPEVITATADVASATDTPLLFPTPIPPTPTSVVLDTPTTEPTTVDADAETTRVTPSVAPIQTRTARPSSTPVPSGTPTPRPTTERRTSAEDDISRELTATSTRTPTTDPQVTQTPTRTPRPTKTPQPDITPIPIVELDLSPFGVEVNRGAIGDIDTYMQELRDDGSISWVRFNGVVWPEIEATRNDRSWNNTDNTLNELVASGITPMVIIRGTPDWAQQDWNGSPPDGAQCSPIRQDELAAFADFVSAAVERYSQAPYNVRYWEIGNEPDVDPELVSDQLGFGCWGDDADEYYGGGYYAEMLKTVYPVIKEADPDAVVVLGGLLLDCDPTNPPEGKDCQPGRFLEGILDNGGGNFFDVVAYHGYAYWLSSEQDSDRNAPAWQHRGGSMLGKLDFIRAVLTEYNVEKPIIVNEMGLLCYPNTSCDPSRNNQDAIQNFLDAQAGYVIRGYVRAWGNGLASAAWYTLDDPDWRQAGLLEQNNDPRPAYRTLLFISALLKNARFVEELGDGDALEGYAFQNGSTRYAVYWTNDGSSVEVPLPDGTRTIYDKEGNERSASGANVNVNFDPIIIESQ